MTIRENISYGASHEVTSEQVIDAAKKANAYKFINEFPDGFDTLVGERGQMLSGILCFLLWFILFYIRNIQGQLGRFSSIFYYCY